MDLDFGLSPLQFFIAVMCTLVGLLAGIVQIWEFFEKRPGIGMALWKTWRWVKTLMALVLVAAVITGICFLKKMDPDAVVVAPPHGDTPARLSQPESTEVVGSEPPPKPLTPHDASDKPKPNNVAGGNQEIKPKEITVVGPGTMPVEVARPALRWVVIAENFKNQKPKHLGDNAQRFVANVGDNDSVSLISFTDKGPMFPPRMKNLCGRGAKAVLPDFVGGLIAFPSKSRADALRMAAEFLASERDDRGTAIVFLSDVDLRGFVEASQTVVSPTLSATDKGRMTIPVAAVPSDRSR